MKIPKVNMQVPVFTEREYAPTPTSTNPEQEIDVKIREHEVSLEYAAFLINESNMNRVLMGWYDFPREEYIDELFEAFVGTELGRILFETLSCEVLEGVQQFNEETAMGLMKVPLNRMLDNAIENDNTSTLDWI